MSDHTLLLAHTAPIGPPARKVPYTAGASGTGAASTVATTCAAGAFVGLCDFNNTLSAPALQLVANGDAYDFIDIVSGVVAASAGGGSIGFRISYIWAPAANFVVPCKGNNRKIVFWLEDVDPTNPIIEAVAHTEPDTQFIVPALGTAGVLAEPAFVAVISKQGGTAARVLKDTVADPDLETALVTRRIQNEASSEARMGDTDGLVAEFFGQVSAATATNGHNAGISIAIRGELL